MTDLPRRKAPPEQVAGFAHYLAAADVSVESAETLYKRMVAGDPVDVELVLAELDMAKRHLNRAAHAAQRDADALRRPVTVEQFFGGDL